MSSTRNEHRQRRRIRRGLVVIATLSLLAGTATHANAGDRKTYPGSICHTNIIDDSHKDYYQSAFGAYFHLSDSPAVLCPILRDVGTNTDGLANVVVWISAPGAGSVGCGVYMLSAETGMIVGQASQGVTFGDEGGVKKLDFRMPDTAIHGPGVSAEGPIGLACGLPRGFTIIGYMVEEFAAGDSE